MKQRALWRLCDVLRTSGMRELCDVLHTQDVRACMIHWKDFESDSVQFGVVLLFVVWLITIGVTGECYTIFKQNFSCVPETYTTVLTKNRDTSAQNA